MKSQEVLLASGLIALVAGGGAAFATLSLRGASTRMEPESRASAPSAGAPGVAASDRGGREELELLRLSNDRLEERLAALESRLADIAGARIPQSETRTAVPSSAERSSDAPDALAHEVTPDFVASVGQALDVIHAREEAEREDRRKEVQAQRIEERVTRLQQELGLSSRQSSDLRTALIHQDDQRERLFTSMREGNGEPQDMRENFRKLRDETNTTLQGFLTADQFTRYREIEESDFGRRGFGDFGGPGGGRPPEDGRRFGR